MTDRHWGDEDPRRPGDDHPDDLTDLDGTSDGLDHDRVHDESLGDESHAAHGHEDDAHGYGHDVHDHHDDVHDHHDDVHDDHDGVHDDHDGPVVTTTGSDPGRRRRFVVLGVALAILLGGIVLAFQFLAPIVGGFLESNDYDGPGQGQVNVVVNEGDSGRAIATTLVEQDVVKSIEAFEEALASTPGDHIQPGTYVLAQQMSAEEALSALRGGDARDETSVTLPEGLRAEEIYAQLAQATGEPLEAYTEAAQDPEALGLPEAAQGEVEGFLFPATYTFGPDVSAQDQLRQLVSQSTGRLSALGVTDEEMRDVVTIASIIEAEARLDEDFGRVAGVIENRLRINMALQMDSTVAYGVGKRTLTTTDQERADDNPYNTYLHPGLPAGPINNPGAAAIEAAKNPAEGDWLYFVTVNPQTGETKFAATHDEHLANVREFQQWCQVNPGQC